MLDTIVLLTGLVEQPVLGSILQGHNPALTVRPVATLAEVMALAPDTLRGARLVAFSTDVVVPLQVLDRICFGA
jgi:methionyl-tRNA formyltransferase